MKKLIGLIMICSVLFSPLIAHAEAYFIYFENQELKLDTSYYLYNDTVYVPLREISGKFGGEVRWHPEANGIAILNGSNVWLIMQDGSGLYKDGRLNTEKAAILKNNGVTMVPIRLVAKIFNLDLSWDPKTSSITLSKIVVESKEEVSALEDTSIMGQSVATAEQMAKFLLKYNSKPKIPCTALELAQMYLEEGDKEGVRGDFAFAQSIQETGYFKFGGNVKSSQYNYAGMGSTSSGVMGSSFSSAREGIRAQIQHLKAYASTEPLNEECVDGRFSLVTRGTATRLEDLANALNPNNAGWAHPGYDTRRFKSVTEAYEANQTYGQKIKTILERILSAK